MKRAVRDVGYQAQERSAGADALDRERQARQEEVRRQGRNLVVAGTIGGLVMLGTFYDMLGPLKVFVPVWLSYKWVLGLLATPIVFGPGRQFFVQSWRGLKHGVTDMNLLYATGSGAADGVHRPRPLAGGAHPRPDFGSHPQVDEAAAQGRPSSPSGHGRRDPGRRGRSRRPGARPSGGKRS